MKKYYLLIFLFFLLSSTLLAQSGPIKFGKISKEEIAIETNSTDAEFGAVILCDYGEIEISNGLLTMYRHTRIKILNQNGLDEANIVLPYYTKDNMEKIVNIRAQTLNVDQKGKVKKNSVSKKEIYTSDPHENWKEKRFTFSDVRPGSIIEYQYLKRSENIVSLEPWFFQNKLPTLKSELKAKIQGELDFRLVYNGNRLISKYGKTTQSKWTLENLPPLKEEPHCPNPQDYVESIKFQLAGYKKYDQLGGSNYVKLMTTWENLATELLEDLQYRKILGAKKKAKQILEQIISPNDSKKDRVKKIYQWVQKNLIWNKSFRLFPEQSFSNIIEKQRASSGEINLVLVRLLQSAGFDANPLIISTKGHGLVTKIYPLYNQFNHILAQVQLDGKDILMDATSDFRPYNLLAKRDLNPFGFLLHKKESRWIDIPLTKKTKTIAVTELSFTDDKMKYKIDFSLFKHDAANHRWYWKSEDGKDDYVKKYLIDFGEESEIELDSFSVKYADQLEKPFSVTCHFSQELEDGMQSDIIYLSPFLIKHFKKNPFNNPVRYLPVDFIVPFAEKYIFNMNIPKDYELAELPQNLRLTTSEKRCNYDFLFQEKFGRVQLSSNLNLTDPLIFPAEYPSLRELFTQLMAKQEVQLVLRKK